MCGGKVLIATCARVGHVFRKVSPYQWPGGFAHNIIVHNTLRTVHVWMDKYADFYLAMGPSMPICTFHAFRITGYYAQVGLNVAN